MATLLSRTIFLFSFVQSHAHVPQDVHSPFLFPLLIPFFYKCHFNLAWEGRVPGTYGHDPPDPPLVYSTSDTLGRPKGSGAQQPLKRVPLTQAELHHYSGEILGETMCTLLGIPLTKKVSEFQGWPI